MEYSAVFWDIGGVIVELKSIREGYARFVEELADEHGLDSEEALEIWREALGDHFRDRDGTEYRIAREGYRKATEALLEEPPKKWRERFNRCLAETLRTEPRAVETIQALDDAGHYLGIVSDIDEPEAHEILERFGVRACFDDVTTSEAVGYTKPDAKMFETALAKADIDPDRGLMVGDRYRHDIEAAAEHGLDTVAYGKDSDGPASDYRIEDLGELLSIVGLDAVDGR